MLCKNIARLRKDKSMTQEELATALHVVRQTVSKWEKGLSVPDAEMLVSLSEVFEVPVSELLGAAPESAAPEPSASEELLQRLSEELASVNAAFARSAQRRRRIARGLFVALLTAAVLLLVLQLFACYFAADTALEPVSVTTVGGADGPAELQFAVGANPVG